MDPARLQGRLTALAEQYHVVGASLAFAVGDDTALAATGVLNTRTGTPVTVDSVFQIGSITKVWTATLVMQLVDEGLVDLDAPLRTYLPDFRILDEDVSAGAHRPPSPEPHQRDRRGLLPRHRPRRRLRRSLRRGAGRSAGAAIRSGRRSSYCNAGFVVLGRGHRGGAWAVVGHGPARAPLHAVGRTSAGTLPEEALLWGAAVGHFGSEVSSQWGLPRAIGPAGLIQARAVELPAFARLHLADGVTTDGERVLSVEGSRAMRAAQVTIPEPWSSGSFCRARGGCSATGAARCSVTTARRSQRPPTSRSCEVVPDVSP